MRFFTRGWADGEYSDAQDESAKADYQARMRELAPRFTPPMARLANENLHDAILESARWAAHTKELQLCFIAGTSETGYRAVSLTYRGAMLGKQRVEALRRVARDREACVLYDEVDLDERDGTLIHRYLFGPSEELTIDFVELAISVEERADKRVPLDAFHEELPEEED
jgi:hypothetical protein